MHLGQLWAVLPQVDFLQRSDPASVARVMVSGIAYDSRQVKPGDLFVAIPGTRLNGLHFVAEAVRKGAVAVVADRSAQDHLVLNETGPGVPVCLVPKPRLALALMAHTFYHQPSHALDIVCVTGTNGKTTTTKMAQAILRSAGYSPAFMGTVGYQVGKRVIPAPTTTPQSLDLARLFREVIRAGQDSVVMEASSHALDQDRISGTKVRVAAFTNLSRDHQDYHENMEAYFQTKVRLFEELDSDGVVVANVDDRSGRRVEDFARNRGNRVITCGKNRCDVRAERVRPGMAGTRFHLHTPLGKTAVHIRIPGLFNVANAVLAAGIGCAMGVGPDDIVQGLNGLDAVPGRMERIPVPDSDTLVVVDYAHTHVALENVLTTLQDLNRRCANPGRLTVLFGCGGDRDPGRRSRMGKVAARLADRIIVTSDNPRSEDPEAIIRDILKGIASRRNVQVETDRRQAIRLALEEAGPRDTVLIAGKGHEDYQIFKDVTIPFDDREEVRAAIRARYSEVC